MHSNAVTTSKMIDTKQITEKLKSMDCSDSLVFDFTNLNSKDDQIEQELQTNIEIPPK